MSVSQSNSTQTTEIPSAETERSRRTPDDPLTADSSGKVTKSSISSGAIPGASVMIVTVGADRSGKMSTGNPEIQAPPTARRRKAPVTTRRRCRSENRINLSERLIVTPQWTCPWASPLAMRDERRIASPPRSTNLWPGTRRSTSSLSPWRSST